MPKLMTQGSKIIMPGIFALFLSLAVACGAADAPAENTAQQVPASQQPSEPEPMTAQAATAAPQQQSQSAQPVQPARKAPAAASEPPAAQPAVARVAPAQPEPVAQVEDPPEDRPTMEVGVIWLSTPMDPVESGWVPSQSGLSENLFRLSAADMSPEPWLATYAKPIDELSWEIGLREDVTFHNGNVMDSEAVKASLERTIRMNEGTAETLAIDSITVKDDRTILLTTSKPNPTLPGRLTGPAVGIHDAVAADAAGEGNFMEAGALTGPYIATHFVMGEVLETVANDDYWGGTPPLAGINHIAIPDGNSRELALQAGDVDIAINLSPEGTQIIDANPGTSSETAGIGTSVSMWWVNFERGALTDPLVRQAVAHAIDRESIAAVINPPGTGFFAANLLPEALVTCEGVTGYAFDPDHARELLAEAGYADSDGDGIVEKDGQPLQLIIGAYPQRPQLPIMAETAQAMLGDVGIGVEVLITEWAKVQEPGWDLFGWFNSVVEAGDPILNVSKFAGLEANGESGGANNYGHYDNAALAQVIAQSGGVADLEARKQIACDALEVVTDDVAFLPISHGYMVYGVSEDVTGFEAHPTRYYFVDHRVGLAE